MNKLLELITQRRIWAGIVGVATVIFGWLGISLIHDPNTLTDLLLNLGATIAKLVEMIGGLVAAGLAIWSYFRPKSVK
jgi:membrane associated rhomboid family serine protease